MNEYKQKQISEIAQVLKDYTEEKKISASHAILDDYAELIYNAGYRKQNENKSLKEILQMVTRAYDATFLYGTRDIRSSVLECATQIYIAQMKGGAE